MRRENAKLRHVQTFRDSVWWGKGAGGEGKGKRRRGLAVPFSPWETCLLGLGFPICTTAVVGEGMARCGVCRSLRAPRCLGSKVGWVESRPGTQGRGLEVPGRLSPWEPAACSLCPLGHLLSFQVSRAPRSGLSPTALATVGGPQEAGCTPPALAPCPFGPWDPGHPVRREGY